MLGDLRIHAKTLFEFETQKSYVKFSGISVSEIILVTPIESKFLAISKSFTVHAEVKTLKFVNLDIKSALIIECRKFKTCGSTSGTVHIRLK